MAKSQYEYVRLYEQDDRLLPGCWIVVRLDGNGFTKFCDLHDFEKPNDARALALMDAAAKEVVEHFPMIRIAFGESDEYSFVFPPDTSLYGRRSSKIVSLVVSCFSSAYVRRWPENFPTTPLRSTPLFDGRAICYPVLKLLKDYLAWRQVDTHINNLYNTCFWALVKDGATTTEAHAQLKGTRSEHKNELLFSRFGTNYNNLPERFRKGSTIIWTDETPNGAPASAEGTTRSSVPSTSGEEPSCPTAPAPARSRPPAKTGDDDVPTNLNGAAGEDASAVGPADDLGPPTGKMPSRRGQKRQAKARRIATILHVDIIRPAFWKAHPELIE